MATTIIRLNPSEVPSGNLYSERSLEERAETVFADIESSMSFFTEKWAAAWRNHQFYANRQWTPAERQAFARQMRIPFVFNDIAPQVDNICGQQMQTRLDVKLSAVDLSDQTYATVGNRCIKWFEQVNDISTIESEVFKSAIVQGVGITQVRWDFADMLSGFPKIERVPIYQMLWDTHSKDITMDDCKWIARVVPLTKADAIEMFPEHKTYIEKSHGMHTGRYFPIMNGALQDLQWNQQFRHFSVSNSARHYTYAILHYEQIKRYQFVLVDEIRNEITTYDSKSEAESAYMGRYRAYAEAGDIELRDENGIDLINVYQREQDSYLQSIILGDECVEYGEVDLPSRPFQLSFANYLDGDFWSYVDGLIHPQRFKNRQLSEVDNQVARSAKNLTEVVAQQLEKGWTIEHLRNEMSKTQSIIPVKQLGKALNIHPNAQVSSDFYRLISIADEFMVRKGGGQNIMGLAENAAESSKTVRARQSAAGLGRVPFFQNFSLWRKHVTENALWMIKNYVPAKFMPIIIGDDPDVAGLQLEDTDVLDTIVNMRTNIAVTPVPDTEIAREQLRNELQETFQMMQGQVPYQVFLPMLLEVSGIPQAQREKLLGYMESYQRFEQEQQEKARQELLQAQSQKAVQGEVMRDTMREQIRGQGAVNPQNVLNELGQ